jgi:endonuclease/exonuclease/phosphatase family metal-dependent hydrolase
VLAAPAKFRLAKENAACFPRRMLVSRRHLLGLLILPMLALGGCSGGGAPGNRLRVVDWNLEWFPGGKPDATPEQQAAQMKAAKKAVSSLQPDLLLLQEVRDWNAAAELSSVVPGLNVHLVTEFGGRPQNQVIAAKLPADSAWSAQWKKGPIDPPRGYAFAALQLPGNRFLLTYSLHLKSNLGDFPANVAMRRESVRQLLTHAQEMLTLYRQRGPCAVLIAGDMNTSLDDPKFAADPSLKALRAAGFHWTHEGVPFASRTTIPADNQFPDNCFDHIFTLGLGKQTAAAKPFQKISDHYPVLLDVDLDAADFQGEINMAAANAELDVPLPVTPEKPVLPGTLNATDDASIRGAVGKIAAVRGKVAKVAASNTGSITFIDFEGGDRKRFTAIVRRDRLGDVSAPFGGDLAAGLTGKTVEIRGAVELYRQTPEIVLTQADQIAVIPD